MSYRGYLPQFRFNIILSRRSFSFSYSLSKGFAHQNSVSFLCLMKDTFPARSITPAFTDPNNNL